MQAVHIPTTSFLEYWGWVSDTVLSVSGFRPQRLCGLRRMQVLTCAESGVDACQEVFEVYFVDQYLVNMLHSAKVGANVAKESANRD